MLKNKGPGLVIQHLPCTKLHQATNILLKQQFGCEKHVFQFKPWQPLSNLALSSLVHHPDQCFFELLRGIPRVLLDVAQVPQGVGRPVQREV